jgi:hypothetical protein
MLMNLGQRDEPQRDGLSGIASADGPLVTTELAMTTNIPVGARAAP